MPRALVTGGAGFIGSNLVDRLLAEGWEVTVVDDLSSGKLENLAGVGGLGGTQDLPLTLERVDITTEALDETVGRTRPDVVLHLAAQIDVRRSVADPLHDATVNVLGTVRLLEACRKAEVGKVVFTTSGGCIYGEPARHELPISETYEGHPHSQYGASKRGVEEYLYTYAALYGLRWTSLALANVYGPRQDPTGEAGVVSIFGGRLLDGRPITIYGDGEQTRDFVFVTDVVDAFVRAIDAGDGLRCNIGTGAETSVNELYRQLADLAGSAQEPEHAAARNGELAHIALDVSRAAAELGWKPRWALRDGLAQTLDWLRG